MDYDRRHFPCQNRGMKFTVNDLLYELPKPANVRRKDGVWDVEPFSTGNVKLVFFAPRDNDLQTFHDEDEFYFIARGGAELIIALDRFAASAGDAFFVPARVPHHFESMTLDFATWGVFF